MFQPHNCFGYSYLMTMNEIDLAKKPNSNINSDLIMKQVEQKYYNLLVNKFVNMRLNLSTYATTNKTYSNKTFLSRKLLILSPKPYGDETTFVASSWLPNVPLTKFSSLNCLFFKKRKNENHRQQNILIT